MLGTDSLLSLEDIGNTFEGRRSLHTTGERIRKKEEEKKDINSLVETSPDPGFQ
jgi:hypothetical protein